jgi:Ubiquitin carboxyl-terminal hydrolase
MMLPTGRVVKNNSPVRFENILDINDLVLGLKKESITSKINAAFRQRGIFQACVVQDDLLQKREPIISTPYSNRSDDVECDDFQPKDPIIPTTETARRDSNLQPMSANELGQNDGIDEITENLPKAVDTLNEMDRKCLDNYPSTNETLIQKKLDSVSLRVIQDVEDGKANLHIEKLITTIPSKVVQPAPPGPFIYKLSAVILHYGNHDSGHFVTLRRVIDASQREFWFRVSDADVERILDVDREVFEHGSRNAYMIFYERLP